MTTPRGKGGTSTGHPPARVKLKRVSVTGALGTHRGDKGGTPLPAAALTAAQTAAGASAGHLWVMGKPKGPRPHSGTSFHLTEQGVLAPATTPDLEGVVPGTEGQVPCASVWGGRRPADGETEVDERFRVGGVIADGTECPFGVTKGLWEQTPVMAT